MFRQLYKEKSKEFCPVELPLCLCKKPVSPDENLVMCGECGIFYHYHCSDNLQLKCSYCSEPIDEQEL